MNAAIWNIYGSLLLNHIKTIHKPEYLLKTDAYKMTVTENWKPLYNILESFGLKATIANSRHMKAIPE